MHDNIIAIQGDVTSKADLQRVTEKIAREIGHVNLFVANAGVIGETVVSPPGITHTGDISDESIDQIHKRLWNTDQELFNRTLSVNVSAVYYSIVAFLPLLDAGNKKGNVVQTSQVITTSSIAAFSRRPVPSLDYTTSKAASVHMMKQFATIFSSQFAKHQIRFNTFVPGSTYPHICICQTAPDLPYLRPKNEIKK